MKLLFENWRKYLDESLSVEEAECMTLFNFEFIRIQTEIHKHGPDKVAPEVIDIVSDDVPEAWEIYMNLPEEDIGIKKEFLKELMLEYVVDTIVDYYRNITIEDYIDRKEKEFYKWRSKRQKEAGEDGQPNWWHNFLKCLKYGAGTQIPYYSDKKIDRAPKSKYSPGEKIDDTWVMESE